VWNTYKILSGPIYTGGFDGLAHLRLAPDSIPRMLAGYNSDDQKVHTHMAPIHSIIRQ
jgi:hypothetical protein